MRKFSNLPKIVSLIVFLLIIYTEVFAQAQYTPAPRRTQSGQEIRQQLQQEASTAMTEVDATYKKILDFVNSGQIPSKEDLDASLKTIAKNRKYLPVLNNSQKSTYHILSAWVYYFDNKQDKASKQAASAQKVASKNPNTVKTRLALSIIYKDYASVIEALTEQSTNSRPGPQTDKADVQSYQQGSENDIQLDVNAVRIGLLGKVFDFYPEPVGADSPSWRSAGQLACAILWKIDANELDSFAPVEETKPAETNEPNIPVSPPPQPVVAPAENIPAPMPQPAPEAVPQQQYQAEQTNELKAFSKLQNQFEKDRRIAFIGINLNDPTKTKNLANWLNKNPQTWRTFILSPEGQQKMFSCLGGSFDKPLLLIVAPDSTIRYAGNVEGFLPQMVIHKILENPQEFAAADFNEPNQPPAAPQSNLPAVEPVQPVQLPAGPNISPVLTADVNKTDVNTPQPQQSKADANTVSAPAKQKVNEDFSVADDYQAETLLSNARTFLKIGNRLPAHMYREPVEMCRRVMKDYPNTKYAQEAQMLLRNVPKEHRQQYNLTDEELGL